MNPIPLPYQLLGVGVALVASYAVGRYDGSQLAEGAAAREDRIAEMVVEKATASTATAIANIEVKNVTIRQTVQREIIRDPVYTDCKHSPVGLQSVNAAITGTSVTPGDRKLP